MRPKVVFALLLLAILVLAGAFLLKQHLRNVPPPPPEIVAPAPTPASNVRASVALPPAPVTAAPVSTNVLTDEQRQAAIDAETDRLQQWSMNDDPESLSNILADLTSPEKEVREAAIEAAEQFGSTNAIPALKALAANTTDTEEQIALLEAANFLSLPSVFDGANSTTPAEREARRQARMQNRSQSQNPPAAPNN